MRLEVLEGRQLLTAANLYLPPADLYPSQDLVTPPLIHSQNGTLDAELNMVRAGFDADPILYGGEPVSSSISGGKPVYAMAYQVDAYGQSYPAQFPGPILQLNAGDTLRLHVTDNLADPGTPPTVVFDSNLHTHGLRVSPLSNGDNIYREITPGEGMDVNIPVPADHPHGVNWYHVHRHGSTHEQVYGGLAGMLLIGDPLDSWPQYKGSVTEQYLALSEVNIQDGKLTNYNAPASGSTFTTGWQKPVNGQVNPTIHIQPGETQVWNLAAIGAIGAFNIAITDGNLQNPWNGTILMQDGGGDHLQPYSLSLAADPARMQDLDAATLIMEGGRLTLAVTAPTTPGTYYLIDGWGGQDKPAVDGKGTQSYYVLATIQVDGDPVTFTPVFRSVGGVDPLFFIQPDVTRTFEFSIDPGVTPALNVFLINGKTFGKGVMPQLQTGTVEEWVLTNPKLPNANANHPFHIHQGNFIVVAVNGIPVDPFATAPPSQSSLAFISPRDIIDIPTGGSVTIRFRVSDEPGKYVFHCHILKHEDQGMMSPVLQFGPAEGLRMPFGTQSGWLGRMTVLSGTGKKLGTVTPFPFLPNTAIVTAVALGASQFFQTMVVGTGSRAAVVKVYENGSLRPSATFNAFQGAMARSGISVAAGDLKGDGSVVVAVGSRAHGRSIVRLFDTNGNLLHEYRDVIPGLCPTGVNLAVGDVNGDNYDDLVIAAGRGREPIVTALDGREIAEGKADPAHLFTFVAGGGSQAGARVAVGYVAPGSVPSYLANVITTPESGRGTGLVEVWNSGDLLGGDPMNMDGHGMSAMSDPPSPMPPRPILSFRPFATGVGPLQLGTSYLGKPGVPVITSWYTPARVAFSSIDVNNQVATRYRWL